MSNLIGEEKVLLQDVFLVKVELNQMSIGSNSECVYLKDFSASIQSGGKNFSLLANDTMFDSLLMDRLAIPNTHLLEYLSGCYNRACDQKEKPWNIGVPNKQNFLEYSMSIIMNYAQLSLNSAQMFPNQWVDPSWNQWKREEDIMSSKVMTFLETCGFQQEFYYALDEQLQNEKDTADLYIESLLNLLIEKQKTINILDSKHQQYLEFLCSLLQLEPYKAKFFNLSRHPFIPNPARQNIKTDQELEKVRGIDLEQYSALGPFLRVSTIDCLNLTEADLRQQQKMREKLFTEFNQRMTKQNYNLQCKSYGDLSFNYTRKLNQLFKILFKGPYQKIILRFVTACLIGNKDRTKLARRLQQQNVQNQSSSDAFLVNLYDVMLEFCIPIIESAIISDPQKSSLYLKIYPQYFAQAPGLKYLQEEPIFKKEIEDNSIEEQIQIGTITEYFFLCQQLIHFGLSPIFNDFKDNAEQLQRSEKEFQRMPQNHPYYRLAEKRIRDLKAYYFQYNAFLQMEYRLKNTLNFYSSLFILLPKWLNLDVNKLENNEIQGYRPSRLLTQIPENILLDVHDFHFFYTNFRMEYVKNDLDQNYLNSFLNMTVILLSNCQISSNPYAKAKFVEILYFFYQQEKNKLNQTLLYNEPAKKNITSSLVKFYIDIEFTGDSHQFYSKFNYRHYVNYLFQKLWVDKVFQNELLKITSTSLFERFVNMIINDATYCTDEGISNMQKAEEMKSKTSTDKMTPQDFQMYDRIVGTSAHFNKQSKEMFSIIANLSEWAPHQFLSEVFIDIVSQMLNNFLKKLMDSCLVQFENKDYSFKSSLIIKDILTIYVNLGHNQIFKDKVLADTRSFDKEIFTNALRKVIKEHAGSSLGENFHSFLQSLDGDNVETFFNFPEEFRCKYTQNLMKDPVMLPSKHIVDREAIVGFIEMNYKDPFTYLPLQENQLVPLPDLKQQIIKWKASQTSVSGKSENITDEQLEEALDGDIPDEFCCGLTFCLVKDPVKLPTSGIMVERCIIRKALLDNEMDPFNRQPLKAEQLIEIPELVKKLNKWKDDKKKELKEKGLFKPSQKMEIEEIGNETIGQGHNLFRNLE